jgi:hypothetical protein
MGNVFMKSPRYGFSSVAKLGGNSSGQNWELNKKKKHRPEFSLQLPTAAYYTYSSDERALFCGAHFDCPGTLGNGSRSKGECTDRARTKVGLSGRARPTGKELDWVAGRDPVKKISRTSRLALIGDTLHGFHFKYFLLGCA